MKKILFLSVVLLNITIRSGATEGMWLPLLLGQLNEAEMRSMGLELSVDDIYNINRSSMKDAIVHFGGGCTSEIISPNGLLLTNHHCGYGRIQAHSSVEKDYLTDGFWAMSKKEELANPGLTATLIKYIEDVTDRVLEGVSATASEEERNTLIDQNSEKIVDEATKDTHYEGDVKSFFKGNRYYLFVTETFKDVRLVGAPPSSIGKYGADTDNWMWPRHTGDFSLFRIYADKDNKPAEYSEDNVPYRPAHHLPVSLEGIKEGDFTMVFGFPGRTNEYLPSYAIEQTYHVLNPARIEMRETI